MKSWKEENNLQNLNENNSAKFRESWNLKNYCDEWNIPYQEKHSYRGDFNTITLDAKDFSLKFFFNQYDYLSEIYILKENSKITLEGSYYTFSTSGSKMHIILYDMNKKLIANIIADKKGN